MGKNAAFLIALALLTASSIIAPMSVKAASKTITVPDDFPTIRKAVANATSGDTVFVRNGIYHENITIDKSVSLIGEDSKETVINGPINRYGPYYTVQVIADNVKISGFTITGTSIGIELDNSVLNYGLPDPSGCSIIGNNIENTNTGISAEYDNLVISGNNITGNLGHGIYVSSSNSVISDNNISGNGGNGIIIDTCADVTISGNSITGNGAGGLRLRWDGPFYVYGNNITDNEGYGIQFGEGCNNSPVYQNNIMRNSVGIELLNFRKGGDAYIGLDNTVYRNNFVDNDINAFVEQGLKVEGNNPQGNGTDVVSWDNGAAGNYWSDYHSQGTYIIDENNIDHYPLMQPVDISAAASSPLTIIVIVAVVILVIACAGLLVYFRNRKHIGATY